MEYLTPRKVNGMLAVALQRQAEFFSSEAMFARDMGELAAASYLQRRAAGAATLAIRELDKLVSP